MRYDETIIERILNSASIIEEFELLGTKIHKKNSSGEYSAFCIFHENTKTPALTINEEKGVYHCFSCGASGNIFTLLKTKRGMEFREAVKYLAEKYNIDISEFDKNIDNKIISKKILAIERLAKLNAIASEYFQSLLQINEKVKEYLKNRGLQQSTIGNFLIGYGGNEKNSCFDFLKKKGFSGDEIINAGLSAKSENGDVFDLFRERIIFPIRDLKGHIVGFSGRILEEKPERAKYFNTKETILFKKSDILYGLYENYQSICDSGKIILVEGYLDVILLWQEGIRYAVSAMGTTFSNKQSFLLQKTKAKKIFLMYDGDEAGKKATIRTILELAGKIEIKVILLPSGKDPDEIVLKKGTEEIKKFCENAIEPLYFFNGDIENSFNFIKRETSAIMQENLLKILAEIIGVSFEAVKLDFDSKFKKTFLQEKKDINKEIFQEETRFLLHNGSEIRINPETWQMWHHFKKWDRDEIKWIETQDLILCTHILIPKYRVKIDDEVFFIIKCYRPFITSFMITVPESACAESTKMQASIIKNSISIQVGRMRHVLHTYFLLCSKEIKVAYVGVNYDKNDIFLCGYDYIYKNGKVYRAQENIVNIEDEIYFIAGYSKKRINEAEGSIYYLKDIPEPNGKIETFIQYADFLFKTKEKSRITLAFLATAMLREKLIERFAEVPSLNFYGTVPSVGKTTLLDALSTITNIKKHKARITEHQLYSLQSERINGLIFIDDMHPLENYIGFLKDAASNSFRPRRDLEGRISNPQIRNSVFMTTNFEINLESENDAEALESRVINILFTKEDQIYSYKHYKKFRKFIETYAFDIYIEMFNKISQIDLNILEERVEKIEEELIKLDLKSSRIIKMWAILLACGQLVGLDIRINRYLNFIQSIEKNKLPKRDFLASAILECAIAIETEANPTEKGKEEIKKDKIIEKFSIYDKNGIVLYRPIVFSKKYFIKINFLTEYFRNSVMLKDFSQENILKELYSLQPIVQKHSNLSRVQWIKGEKQKRVGVYIEIDFGHEIFKKALGVFEDYVYTLPPSNLYEMNEHLEIIEGVDNVNF